MTILLNGNLYIPDDAANIVSIGEFFGYDTKTANQIWDDVIEYFQNRIDGKMGDAIATFVKSLDDHPDGLVRFFYLSLLLGMNYSRKQQIDILNGIKFN